MFHRSTFYLLFFISLFTISPPALASPAQDVPIAAAEVDVAIDQASKKTGDFRILLTGLDGKAASYGYGVIDITHVKGIHRILAPSFAYPDNKKIVSFPFLAHGGEYRFKALLWDPGTYKITVSARGTSGSAITKSVAFSVSPPGDSLRNTFVLYGFLVVLGLLSGLVGGLAAARRDRKKAATMLLIALMGISLLTVTGQNSAIFLERAYAHGGEEHQVTTHEGAAHEAPDRAGAPEAGALSKGSREETMRTPVPNGHLSISPLEPKPGTSVRLALKSPAMSTVPVTLRHLEDDLILFSGGIPRDNFGLAELEFVFPEGNKYEMTGGALSKKFTIQSVDPQLSSQLVALGTMISALIIPMLVAYLVGRFIIGSSRGKEETSLPGKGQE